ncbi:peptidoglycan DD-metalloendopeptidase family protein [Niallia sp. XMNu-256]|uniref:peptidoglycan DD-metalloendopeptidase family protein n=1 Tax=Niallia sp. XMNu-256 TaxID=3082444 RepID=UPI0030D4545B
MREEEKNTSLKKFFKKRWVYPTVYIASAALILTGVLWFQNSNTENATDSEKFGYETPGKNQFNEPADEVARSMENIVLPLSQKDRTNAVIKTKFYEDTANEADQEAAIVVYQNQYHPNTGIDIAVEESEAFDVMAALSGTVTKVQEDALLGNVIEIKHDDNIISRYSSVKDMKVAVGDKIDQGQALATAGKSLFNEEAGVHVHFEIRKDGVPVNPENYLNKPFSELQEASMQEDGSTDSEKSETEQPEKSETDKETSGTEEEPAKDEKSSTEEDRSTSDDESAKEEETSTDEKPSTDKEESSSDEKNADDMKDETTNNNKNQDA